MTADGQVPGAGAIAVIGMAGRFPGARSLDAFWDNLCAGRESIVDLDDEELLAQGVPEHLLKDPDYVKRAAPLDGFDEFDADFFGYSAQAARVLDPQHRLFLETCWHALEDAAIDPARHDGDIGVYGTCSGNAYVPYHTLSHHDPRTLIGTGMNTELLTLMAGGDNAFIATRVSHALDLRGPSLGVQTACSSALVAVHLACQSLLDGECDVALAGGMTVKVPHRMGYRYEPGAIVSRDGRCRAFDARASGTVFGSGGGVVVLKPLADALADGDRVRAVVRGSAVNNDGSLKMAFSAPSVDGQAQVVADAMAVAGVGPDDIGYVETHGTGTALGDPVEIAALDRAFAGRTRPCPIGSVKPNIGHLEYASGMPGLIKTVLAIEHRTLPPTPHYTEPNPELGLSGTPFRVQDRLAPWTSEGPLLAGVSSLGAGGTNVHVVLGEAPAPAAREPAPAEDGARPRVLLVSARGPDEVARAARRLADRLRAAPDLPLDDVAATLADGRRAHEHRRAVVARTARQAAEALDDAGHPRSHAGTAPERPPAVAFLLPGQGSQYPGMTAGLHAHDARFRDHLTTCAGAFSDALGTDVLAAVLTAEEEPLRRTDLAQAALFCVEYALARWLEPWGVRPGALAGHSVGEYTAACLAGVFDLPDAVRMVAARGRLMRQAPPGAMLSVRLSEAAVAAELPGSGLELAAVNEPASCVVAGPVDAVERFAERLTARGVGTSRLRTAHAFHTSAVQDAADRFAAEISGVRLRPPRVPLLSGVTGTWMTDDEAVDHGRWARQLRAPVRFGANVEELLADGRRVLVEVGPGRTLTALARRSPAWRAGHRAVRTVRHPSEPGDDGEVLMLALGALWAAGAEIDWSPDRGGRRPRPVSLPGYPFRRDRHWIPSAYVEGGGAAAPALAAAAAAASAAASATTATATAGREATPSEGAPSEAADRVSERSPRGESGAAGGTRAVLSAIWSELLGVPDVPPDANFFDLRGDSLIAVQLASRASAAGLVMSPQDVFAHQTVAALADAIDAAAQGERGGPGEPGRRDEQGTRSRRALKPWTGPVALTPTQLRLLREPRSNTFHVPLVLEVPGALTPEALDEALAGVVALHDGLRLRVRHRAGLWEQEVAEARRGAPLLVVDGAGEDGGDPREWAAAGQVVEELGAAIAADGYDGGPLLRAAHLPGSGARPSLLVLVLHHLLVDIASERLLLEDLNTACRQVLDGLPVALPPATTPWPAWAARVAALAADPEVHAERALWLGARHTSVRSALGLSPAPGAPAGTDVRCERTVLDAAGTAALLAFQRARRAPLDETLLAAVAVAHERFTGEDALLVDVEGHGRAVPFPGVDLTRTIGSCTTVHPLPLTTGGRGPEGALARAREALRAVPRQGLGHGVLRHLHAPTAALLAEVPEPELMVSYLGALGHETAGPDGGPLRPAPGVVPAARSAAACLGNPLELRCYLSAGRLHLDWWYDARRCAHLTAREWARRTVHALRAFGRAADGTADGAGAAPAGPAGPAAPAGPVAGGWGALTEDERAVLFPAPRRSENDGG
ncbi:beta-ketoacyl synthase N-terminal-like domain-containing protein [Streptomyces sp. URMC 123]|uniref:beta-ketoacyl synthase N-terminal-like domain-containing protein n=1 Tax=Streptomyces sp. URMC 123 TaxID=3423403 RepID=UPI003F1E34D1